MLKIMLFEIVMEYEIIIYVFFLDKRLILNC